MKKTFKFFAAALAIVAAASCAKEIENNTNNESDVPTVHMTFSASIDAEEDTKTTLNGKKVHWTDNDAIGVYYMDRNYLKFNANSLAINSDSNDEDPTYATFSGNVVSSSTYYAVHPAKGWNVQSGATADYLCFDGLRTQNAVLNSFDPDKHISITKATSGDHFEFVNACALAKVKVSGSSNIYSIKIDGAVTSSGNGTYTEGSIGGNLWFKQGEAVVYRAYKNNNHNSIVLANADGSSLQNGGTYYIVLPVCKIGNFKVTLCDKNGEELHSISKTSEFNVERNKIYNLGEIAVPKKYVVSKQITKSTDLYPGNLYVFVSYNNSSMVWTNQNNKLVLSSAANKEYLPEQVFKCYNGDTSLANPSGENYSSDYKARFLSVSSESLIKSDLSIGATGLTAALTFYVGSQWDSESGYDMDIYKAGTSETICANGTSLYWGTTSVSNGLRKWYIYEVKEK